MTGKCLFLPLKGSKSHANYDFPTPGGPIHLPINYRNFAQSPFKEFAQFTKYYQDQFVNIYENTLKPEARVSKHSYLILLLWASNYDFFIMLFLAENYC